MACFHPIEAWHKPGNPIRWNELAEKDGFRHIWLPCGKCIGCRTVKARAWAIRCLHEASLHTTNSFVTLTYNEDNVQPSLNYTDFQKFIRALRKLHRRAQLPEIRFYMCGEYGDENFRPHFHALLFGAALDNAGPVTTTTYRSLALEKCWTKGYSSWGKLEFNSALYVTSYANKKRTGETAEAWYTRLDTRTGELVKVQPEFARMSLKPGIGARWFEKYWREVYLTRDGILRPGGKTTPPPRYYDKLLEATDWQEWERIQSQRSERAKAFAEHTTEARLKVRETCAIAKANFLKKREL